MTVAAERPCAEHGRSATNPVFASGVLSDSVGDRPARTGPEPSTAGGLAAGSRRSGRSLSSGARRAQGEVR